MALTLGVGVASCSLTGDDIEPELVDTSVERSNGAVSGRMDAGTGGMRTDAPCSNPNGCCELDDDCPMGEACVAGGCQVLSCDSAEDVSRCEVQLCPGPECLVPPAPCVDAQDCSSFNCDAGTCQVATCSDSIKNQDEPDVDCGGRCPTECAAGQGCAIDEDCSDGLFCPDATHVCTDVACNDGELNGDEILVDCGGGRCPGCAPGTACNTATDCSSGVCAPNGECAAPQCDNQVANQDETAVDCGGSCDEPCDDGLACEVAEDCSSGVCSATGCQIGTAACCQAATCSDGVANGLEPAVDCGSLASCGLCPVGRACEQDAQCQTNRCNVTCQPLPVCENGQIDVGEVDTDCGGNATGCNRCGVGDRCVIDGDCESDNCSGGVCALVSCDDNTQNGDETDTDCGGSDLTCPRCADLDGCTNGSDCQSGRCAGSVCVSCSDGQQNGAETGLDCGGPVCDACSEGLGCGNGGDCQSGVCGPDFTCCGGSQGNCTRCAQALSQSLACNTDPAPPGIPPVDSTGVNHCQNFLACLAQNRDVCTTRNAPGCSGDNQATDACPHNDYGGNAGTGLTRANRVLESAGCTL